ncbi:hypothetical protein GKZ90_0019480 [Flavobacterium sp. MC2016-06]|uniref:hypothetical protein n=1 Tax=Flavobacterium sp. MC2016-06 TaxID=2676308 RepID=UPI0012BAD96E|nr:hypothetical protein [Flavobacterium sp. MC2016-06]MBU3862156.1 hypothetical protein [Flavobacterium sp. MC2016-06]
MKIQHLFFLALLISCQKEKTVTKKSVVSAPKKKTEIIVPAENDFSKTDTIPISENGDPSETDYILARVLSHKVDKDSIVTVKYQLDFYLNKIKTTSTEVSIENYEKGSEWSASFSLAPAATKRSSFIEVDFGFPACDYTHENYLYYLNNNDLQVVYHWFRMSGSGISIEFTNPSEKPNPDFIYCKTVMFESDDDNDEMGTETHSDSIGFQFKNNKWTKQLLSVEDKVYFKKRMSFNEFNAIK